MDSKAAAADLHARLRYIGDRWKSEKLDSVHFFGTAKTRGEYYRATDGNSYAIFISGSRETRISRADGKRSNRGGWRYFRDQHDFSGFVDQREFRRMDRAPGRCGGRGIYCGSARSVWKGRRTRG